MPSAQVTQLREQLDNDDPELDFPFRSLWGQSVEDRIAFADKGVYELGIDIIKKGLPIHANAIHEAWEFFGIVVITLNVDDEKELIPIQRFADLGGIPLAAQENRRRWAAGNGDHSLMKMMGWLATNNTCTPQMVKEGIHLEGLKAVEGGMSSPTFDLGMSLLRSMCGNPGTRPALRAAGVLDAAAPYVEELKKDDDDGALRRGFRAGSIVARLAGNDETGIGPKLLRGNPVLISKTLEILDRQLDAGPSGMILGMLVDPVGAMLNPPAMDLLTIAASDMSKPLLKQSIPVLQKALRMRGVTNHAMTNDIVQILLQLTFDSSCLLALMDKSGELTQVLKGIVTAQGGYGLNARVASQNLQNAIAPKSKPVVALVPPPPSKFGSLLKKAVSAKKAADLVVGDSSVFKHVMLSYNWECQTYVKMVNEELKGKGVNTWIDIDDMGENLNDSMSQAVENAFVVIVFVSERYKESPNCRRECEYADSSKIPLLYVMVQEGYKPNGWLALLMGRSLWVGMWTETMVGDNMPDVLKVVNSHMQGTKMVVAKSTRPVSPQTGGGEDLATLVRVLTQRLDATEAKVASLTRTVEEMKGELQKARSGS